MRSTHSQNNSGRPLLAAGLTVCTQHAALYTTGDVLQSRMEKKKSELVGFMGVKWNENKDATCQSERRAIRACSTGG